MTVTGTIRVDLSGFVNGGCLTLGDKERYALYRAVATADRALTVQVDLGAADVFDALPWAIDALREAFVGFAHVSVVGDSPSAVVEATRVFSVICTEVAA